MAREAPNAEESTASGALAAGRKDALPLGLVLSGGGTRAAYQVGALQALSPFFSEQPINVLTASSLGAVNALILTAYMPQSFRESVEELTEFWRRRTFRTTFADSRLGAFARTGKLLMRQLMAPGPHPSASAIFDPGPISADIEQLLARRGGLCPRAFPPALEAVAIMTTIEGPQRAPLLFVSSRRTIDPAAFEGASMRVAHTQLCTTHAVASAALPWVLPRVALACEHGAFTLVDGGLCQNVPVEPAVRLGAPSIIVIDASGRSWWLERHHRSLDTRPEWEVAAPPGTFCPRPANIFYVECRRSLGQVLRDAVSRRPRKFVEAIGPTWPAFSFLQRRFGEETAYEAMSYVAVERDYIEALIESGYQDARQRLSEACDGASRNKWARGVARKALGSEIQELFDAA